MYFNVAEWTWVMNATGKMSFALLAVSKQRWPNPVCCSFVFARLLRIRTLWIIEWVVRRLLLGSRR